MLTIKGSNFVPSSTVEWNGNSRTTTVVSSTQLQAHIMAADLAVPGKTNVTVLNSGASPSNAATFTVIPNIIIFHSSAALDGSDATNGVLDAFNIWAVNPDGSNLIPLTKLTHAGNFGPPVWSPDGSEIAFVSNRALDGSDAVITGVFGNIWVMNSDGSGAKPLTKLTANGTLSLNPRWSPDGTKIVFESDRAFDGSDAPPNVNLNLWVMNADGSGAKPLTATLASAANNQLPAWSPDGSKIVFTSKRKLDGSDAVGPAGTKNIWLINADGSGLTPLTKLTAFAADCDFPSWTPDGSRVLFTSERAIDGSDAATLHGTFNIWSIRPDGSHTTVLTQLTSPGASSTTPQASPDGIRIVFASSRALDGSDSLNAPSGTQNIWVMNADGSNPAPLTRITAPGADSFVPIWSPGGTQVFFSSERALDTGNAAISTAVRNIWVVNADGSLATPLTNITAATATNDLPEAP